MKEQIYKRDIVFTIIVLTILRMVNVSLIMRIKRAAYDPKTNFE